jgi:glutathione S-transferase
MQQASSTGYPPALTLYYSPKACSLAPHIALEESDLPYSAVPVDIRSGENLKAKYLGINPSGAVPALGIGDDVITESQAILTYIADLVPETTLLPRPGTRARARAHEWMNWISSSVHVTYRSIFKPQTYAGDDPQAMVAVREEGKKKLWNILTEMEARLGNSPHALGADFSAVDAYLFVFYLWSFDERIQAELPARPLYAAHAARVSSRPAVRRVVARERAVRAYPLPPDISFALDAK